ncbi:MAG: hypothetical protein R2824_15725 [Saprospiraceae bacterium]
MHQQTQARPKASDKGRFKLGVYFITHESHDGKAKYFHSNKSQDKRGISVNRLKKLVLDRWRGKVNWAAIYENGHMISEFKLENGVWEAR